MIHDIQGLAKRRSPGLLNFITVVAYDFCLALPAAFMQPGAHLFAEPCRLLDYTSMLRHATGIGQKTTNTLLSKFIMPHMILYTRKKNKCFVRDYVHVDLQNAGLRRGTFIQKFSIAHMYRHN